MSPKNPKIPTHSDVWLPNVKSFEGKYEHIQGWHKHIEFALKKSDRKGLYCEFGVYHGTTIDHMAHYFTDITFHGFDSFLGLQEEWLGQPAGHLTMDGIVPTHLPNNVKLHPGFFDKTLPVFLSNHEGHASFLHIDCDLYSSTVTILDNFLPRLRPGTVIVFDEYFTQEKDEALAFREFCDRHRIEFSYLCRHRYGGSVAVVIEGQRAE